jgi:predicted hydrocarbon binding protein
MSEDSMPSRSDLVNKSSLMNQMRNAVYHLMRFLKSKNVKNIKAELLEMGRNMGTSFYQAWQIEKSTLENDIKIIYDKVYHSKITIKSSDTESIITVTDDKCPLCKYKYDDIDTAGCFVIIGMTEAIMKALGYNKFKAIDVIESKTNGHSVCKHTYQI